MEHHLISSFSSIMNRVVLFAGILFLFNPLCTQPSYSSEKEKDDLGIAYWIEEKRVEEIYYATMEVFGFANDIEIKFDASPRNSVIVVSVKDALVGGGLNEFKFREIDESWFQLFKAAFPVVEHSQCRIGGVITPNVNAEGKVVGEDLTTIAVFDNQDNSVQEQLVCLYLGTLIGLGVPKERLGQLAEMTPEELAKLIVSGTY